MANKEFNTNEIMSQARTMGIEIDSLYLWLLTSYLVSRNQINGFELRTLYLKILEYMKENNQTENSQFFDYVKNSKALRGKVIDYAQVQKDYDNEKEQWKKLYEQLESER